VNDRVILHCDLNNFFASVEIILDPSLREHAVAVCGDPEVRKGIVLAKCERAKKAGVRTGDAVWMAEQKCPGIKIIKPQHNLYSHYSRRVREIYYRFTDLIEPFGIDEAWLDVTGSQKLFGSGPEIADKIRQTVRDELGLTISVGVSWNKTYAKLGSDIKKPDAVTVITRDNYRDVIFPLPVSDMLFVGRRTLKTLNQLNVHTIGDLSRVDADLLSARFGITAYKLVHMAAGMDTDPVSPATAADTVKSVGNGTTVPRDMTTRAEIFQLIYILAEEVATRLRKKCLRGRTVSLSIRDANLAWCGAQESIAIPTSNQQTITESAMHVFDRLWGTNVNIRPVRGLRVAVSNLIEGVCPTQLDMFHMTEAEDTLSKFSALFDKFRIKHGTEKLAFGTLMGSQVGLDFEVLDKYDEEKETEEE